MALAVSLLDTETSESGSTSITSSSISPSANALLVAVGCFGAFDRPDVTTISDTFGDGVGAWTEHVNPYQLDTGDLSFDIELVIFTAQCSASPGSGTVTINTTTSCLRKLIGVYEVTGHNSSSPVTQVKSGVSTSSTPSLTLDSTPATDAMIFAAIANWTADPGGPNVTPGTGFTELADVWTSVGNGLQHEAMYDIDNADTSVDWGGGRSSSVFGAIEIAIEAAEAAASLVVSRYQRRLNTLLRM